MNLSMILSSYGDPLSGLKALNPPTDRDYKSAFAFLENDGGPLGEEEFDIHLLERGSCIFKLLGFQEKLG